MTNRLPGPKIDKRNMQDRGPVGMALLEVLIAIVIGSMILGGLGTLVHRIYRANNVAGEHLESLVSVGRLSEQLRRDAHEATRADIQRAEDQPTRLLLDAAGGRQIVYELSPQVVYRTVQAEERTVAREAFALGDLRPQDWIQEATSPRQIALKLERIRPSTNNVEAGGQSFSLTARLGSVRRGAEGQP